MAVVRIFGYKGVARIPITNDGGTAGEDSILVLDQPYLWNQLVTTGATSVLSTVASVPSGHTIDPTKLLRVEVPDGSSVRYELSVNSNTVTATAASPLLTGRDQILFGPGWTIALIDA